jgi:hypothetical protein
MNKNKKTIILEILLIQFLKKFSKMLLMKVYKWKNQQKNLLRKPGYI